MNTALFSRLMGVIGGLYLIPWCVMADPHSQYQANQAWAKDAQSSVIEQALSQRGVSEYCDSAACVQRVQHPPQTELTSNDIEKKKHATFESNASAQAVQSRFNQGQPPIQRDPAMAFALFGQTQAFAITHGASTPYVDCRQGTQCVTQDTPVQCQRPTEQFVPCVKTPVATVTTSNVVYRCEAGWTLRGHDCTRRTTQCRYDHDNHVKSSGGNCGRGRGTVYRWDGHIIKHGKWKGPRVSYHAYNCRGGEHDGWKASYQICGLVDEIKPATLTCHEGFSLSGGNCIKNTLTWQRHCRLLSTCHAVKERCVEGKATRNINGLPTSLDCWKYQVDYQCPFADTCAQLPSDCRVTSIRCQTHQHGVCVEEEVQQSCRTKTCRTTRLDCLEASFCLDGECYQGEPTLAQDFESSTAKLAALAKAGTGMSDPPQIFKGKAMACTIKALGVANCCNDRGWGTQVGLASCSDEEKALGQAKEQGLTVALGSYCAKKVFGACLRKKKRYCVFDSKLARIIQAQGVRDQLGLSLGSAKRPRCEAITPEQLQAINFSYLDFSDFYGDLRNQSALPSANEIQARLQSQFQP